MEQADDLHSVRRLKKNGDPIIMIGRANGEIIMKVKDIEYTVFNSKAQLTNDEFIETLSKEEANMLITFMKDLVQIETERLMDGLINEIHQAKRK